MNKALLRALSKPCTYLVLLFMLPVITSFTGSHPQKGNLIIRFVNTANGKPIVLRDSTYINHFAEQYSISRLKYYIGRIDVEGQQLIKASENYHLVDAANEENSIELSLTPGNYRGLHFLLGVDSTRNCSGAQTDALDPMNGMFWTWNSGYIMFKLEGFSPASKADLQRIEHHIGGYKGADNVATTIKLGFDEARKLEIIPGKTTVLTIEMNLDNYWHSTSDIKIAELPLCMVTGSPALKVASNFRNLFSVKEITVLP